MPCIICGAESDSRFCSDCSHLCDILIYGSSIRREAFNKLTKRLMAREK